MCSTSEIAKKSPAYHHIQFHCEPSLQNDQLLHHQPTRKCKSLFCKSQERTWKKKMLRIFTELSLVFKEIDGGHKKDWIS